MHKALVVVMAAGGMLATGAMAQVAPVAPAAQPQAHGAMRADANRDGTITRAEYVADTEARIAAMDTNKDGIVSPEERAAARQAMWARRGGDDGGQRMRGGGKAGGKSWTRAELVDRATARFDRMDTNHDGKLDAAERAAGRSAMHHGRRGAGGPDGAAAGSNDAQ